MSACGEHDACTERALQWAEQICQEQGLRFTTLRRRVLEIIWADHAPTKAYDILAQLEQEHASAKPPTVYRALHFLLEHKLIHKLDSQNAYVGCSHPLEHEACYFLICKRCHVVVECCGRALDQAISDSAIAHNFSRQKTTLEISGECEACLQQ